MRRVIVIVCILSLVVTGVVLAAQARVLYANKYTPQNCAKIAGWDWLRTPNAVVTYEFDTSQLAGCDANKVHLNFKGLCTNGVNGGAGYSATLKCKVRVGGTSATSTIKTINPYRPIDANNSGGVGYHVYGNGGRLDPALVAQAISTGEMKVELAWHGGVTPSSRHIAVKKDALALGYVK